MQSTAADVGRAHVCVRGVLCTVYGTRTPMRARCIAQSTPQPREMGRGGAIGVGGRGGRGSIATMPCPRRLVARERRNAYSKHDCARGAY